MNNFAVPLDDEHEIYKENILDHYKNPRNKKIPSHYTFCSSDHNPLCGDEVTLFVTADDETIADISFTGNGCAISQAAASLLTEHCKGMNLREARIMDQKTVLGLLGIPLSPVRMKCAGLCLKTLHKGLEKYHA